MGLLPLAQVQQICVTKEENVFEHRGIGKEWKASQQKDEKVKKRTNNKNTKRHFVVARIVCRNTTKQPQGVASHHEIYVD